MDQPKDAAGAPVHSIVHTPGPWSVTEGSPAWIGYGVEANAPGYRPTICSIGPDHVFDIDKPSPIAEANARLIAAAPDLLAACREMIEAMDDYECSVDDPPTPKHRQMMLRAMSAVEKATHQVV